MSWSTIGPDYYRDADFQAAKQVNLELIQEFVRKHHLAVEQLTERQLAEAIRQALASGDFVRFVCSHPSDSQSVAYLPYNELQRLRGLYDELLYAVSRKYPNESRHETALRYIKEREAEAGTDNQCSDAKAYEP